MRSTGIAGILFAALAVPAVARALQAHMQAQMLVQIPLLATAGYLLRSVVPVRLERTLGRWNVNGISGLVLATFALAYWMLPRSMDAASTEPAFIVAKYLTVPLLVGLPLGLSWPRMNFVARGVVTMELMAMLFRLGWLYLVSPVRLCSNYLVSDQQRTGTYMLVAGGALLLWVAGKLMCGHFESTRSRLPR